MNKIKNNNNVKLKIYKYLGFYLNSFFFFKNIFNNIKIICVKKITFYILYINSVERIKKSFHNNKCESFSIEFFHHIKL